MISFSSFPMKMLAYDGAIFVPIAVPLICKKCSPLNLSSIVREHWTTIQKHPELCKIFKAPPVLAFREPKSLKDILVRDDISPRSANNAQCQKCDSRRCMTCKNIQCTQQFSNTHTGVEFIIYCNANCKTENIIYLLECAICGLQCIGETKQQLSKRCNGHRS